jgi:hypothetical protein
MFEVQQIVLQLGRAESDPRLALIQIRYISNNGLQSEKVQSSITGKGMFMRMSIVKENDFVHQ